MASAAPAREAAPQARRRRLRPLLVLILIVLVLGLLVFRHFLLVFAVSASVALFLAPVHHGLTRLLRGRRTTSATLLVGLCTVTIFVPILGSATLLSRQAVAFFEWIRPRLQPAALQELWHETIPARYPWLTEWVDFDQEDLPQFLSEALSRGASTLNGLVQGTVAGLTTAFVEVFLFLMMLFFLLRDGPLLREDLRHLSPLSETQESQIFDHLTRTVRAVLLAMVVVPVVQGLVALLGFVIFGVPAPLLWSVMVILAALIPLVGSPLAWLPACLYLFLYGAAWQWVGLLLYGLVGISGIDNLVKPLLLRDAARIHPLLGFLSILGGILSFGPLGFLVGPVVLSLVLSALRIYRLDVLPALQGAEPSAGSG